MEKETKPVDVDMYQSLRKHLRQLINPTMREGNYTQFASISVQVTNECVSQFKKTNLPYKFKTGETK
jgi:hypothetical protein